jgi:RNA polymerase sigma-70 factor (ECF subfamily)
LYRILGGADSERNDLAHEAFERVIVSVTSGRFARSCDLRNWSAVIAKHVALDALRKRKRERKIFAFQKDLELDIELNVPSPTQTPEKALEVRRRLERVAIALQSIQKVRAEAFVLYNVLGYDLAAVARMTGVSVAAAQSRMVRGRGDVLRQIREQERTDK